MKENKHFYVYSRYSDARHKCVTLDLGKSAFFDLLDYIEETRCASVDMRYDLEHGEIWFNHESDFFTTFQKFINHQSNIIDYQRNKIIEITSDQNPF